MAEGVVHQDPHVFLGHLRGDFAGTRLDEGRLHRLHRHVHKDLLPGLVRGRRRRRRVLGKGQYGKRDRQLQGQQRGRYGLVAAQFVHDDGQARGFVRGRQDGEGIGRGFKPDFVRQYALGRQRELARRFGEHGAVGPCVEAFGQRVEEAEYRFGGAFHIARFGGRRIPVFVPRRLLGRILDNGRQIDAHPLEVVDILALRAVVGRQEEDAPLVELEPQYGLEQGEVDLAGSVGQGSRTLLIGQGILPDGVLHLIAQMAARREDGFEGGFGNRGRFGEQGLHCLSRFLGDEAGRRRRRLNGHERGPLYAARRVTGGFPHRIRDEEQDGRQQGGQNRSLERPGCVWIRIRQVHATRGQPFPQCGKPLHETPMASAGNCRCTYGQEGSRENRRCPPAEDCC